MWSGDPQYSQWALNPSAYQNVSHEEVDWAALAQQWIQMKETHPPDQVPPAPPPPPLGDRKRDGGVEGGEAPMDMDTKEEPENSNASSSQDASSWGAWNSWQQWGWTWGAGGTMVPPPNQANKTTGSPGPPYGYPPNAQPFPNSGGVFDYNHAGSTADFSQVMAGSYWSSPPVDGTAVPAVPGGGPSPFIRQHRNDWRRSGRSHDRTRSADKSDEEEDTTTVLDAAKRRQLPAWIREGLEKMEREKQKKLDRERMLREREVYLQKRRLDEEAAMSELQNNSGQPMIPKKSKFESDSEESVRGSSPTPSQTSIKRKSRFRNADSPSSSPARLQEPPKTRDELLQEVMLKVRRTLTEILLEVTTEEMDAVAHEVLSKARSKAPALQLRKTQALASLTGKLGLGMYGDSEDSDSGEEASPGSSPPRQANGADSDQELKERIIRRKQDFVKTEREIEARLHEMEEQEKARELDLAAEESDSEGEGRQVENQTGCAPHGSEEDEKDEIPRLLHPQDSPEYEDKTQGTHDSLPSPPLSRRTSRDESKSDHVRKMKPPDSPTHHGLTERSVTPEENEESSSKSHSESSSSSDSSSSPVRSSSSESRRSSKKSSKSSKNGSHSRRHDRRSRGESSRYIKRSVSAESESSRRPSKKSSRSREKKRSSREMKHRRSHSREERGREYSRRKSHGSDRHSRSPLRSKRRHRDSSGSASPSSRKRRPRRERGSGSISPGARKRRVHRERGRYSRSRSNSSPPRRKKMPSRRRDSSGSSERSMGKKSGHGRYD